MNSEQLRDQLGEPDISLPNLSLWIRGVSSPENVNYTGFAWYLAITANCSTAGADVWCFAVPFEVPHLVNWLTDLEKMHNFLANEANLVAYDETELKVMLTMNRVGLIDMHVEIAQIMSMQSHSFDFGGNFDQSYLPKLMSSCRKVIAKYSLPSK